MTSPAAAWRGLAVLVVVALYTYADRQLLALQSEAIKASFGIGDAQFGLLQGTSVALFTVVAAYPLAWLADRVDRRRVYAACVLLWALAIGWCSRASSFPELFWASAMIGAAEAGLLPLAYVLITEWFIEARRPLANSLYVFLGRLSVGLVIVACGALIQALEVVGPALPFGWDAWPTWRLSLLATAMFGLLLLPLVVCLPRGQAVARSSPGPLAGERLAGIRPWLSRHALSFGGLCAAFGLMTMGASAVGAFIPALAIRQWQVSALDAGKGLGAAAFAGSIVALLASAWLMRRVDPGRQPAVGLRAAAVALALSALTTLALPLARTPSALCLLYAPALAGVMTTAMLLPGVMQSTAPAELRARLMAFFVGASVLGGAVGPALTGHLSDLRGGDAAGLAAAMTWVGTFGLVASTFLLVWARRSGERSAVWVANAT